MSHKVSIAVFGLGGALGAPVLAALQSSTFAAKIQYPIKAVSRSKHTSTDKIHYIQSDLTNVEELAKELHGIDVVVDLLGANPVSFGALEKIVTIIKPKLFIPSQFGVDIAAVSKYAPGFLGLKTAHSQKIRDTGIKTIDISTSLFAFPGSFLYETVGSIGIDPKAKTYTVRGSLEQEISISRAEDIGNTVASVATSDFFSLPDSIRIYSENIPVQKVISTYEKNHDVKLTKGESYSAEESLKKFKEIWAHGFDGSKFSFYLHSIISQGVDKGANFGNNQRELVNPGESLWKWGKY